VCPAHLSEKQHKGKKMELSVERGCPLFDLQTTVELKRIEMYTSYTLEKIFTR
jgi:hypothetical protein